jgi:hypothetical protein
VSAVADALPSDDVPEVRVENVPVVNDGLEEILIVLVPEKITFAPAVRNDTGVL